MSTHYTSSHSSFIFTDTATTEIYTLSLHDALPILRTDVGQAASITSCTATVPANVVIEERLEDRKSTRLNSSHITISYAVFCLKKKNKPYVLKNMIEMQNGQHLYILTYYTQSDS